MISAHMLTLGDWANGIRVPLRDVLGVSMAICGRTGEEACKHAIILMAQSARAAAKESARRRPVGQNATFRHLLRKEQYRVQRQKGADMSAYYKWAALKLRQPPNDHRLIFANQPREVAIIGNRGLLKRSWMWGLSRLGGKEPSGKQIPGVNRIWTIMGDRVSGYIKENRLSYVIKGMPGEWEADVERKAGNKIMAQARNKIMKQWMAAMRSPKGGGAIRPLQSYFLRVA